MTLESAADAGDLNPVHLWKTKSGQVNVTPGTLFNTTGAYYVEIEKIFSPRPRKERLTSSPRSKDRRRKSSHRQVDSVEHVVRFAAP